MDRPKWITILCTGALAASLIAAFAAAQEPAPPPPSSDPNSQAPRATPSKPGKTKYSHVSDFLIHGTVFTDKALSFPGVQLRIRRAGEKKLDRKSTRLNSSHSSISYA